jgi:hypothetical protein
MVFRRPGSPKLSKPISTVSPSFAAQMEICGLAAIFARDDNFKPLARRGSHFAALGEICHRLWESEGRGDFDGIDDTQLSQRLNAAWDEAEIVSLGELRESLGGVMPPPPNRWPDYMAKRLGALALIKRSVLGRRQTEQHRTGAGRRPTVEAPITTPGVAVQGRPDRIIWAGDEPQIVDLKTCAAGDEMKLEHRRQLLAYAVLVHSECGRWPPKATIQYVDGSQRTIEVDPAEAQSIAAEMTAALDSLNGRADDPESLARPSRESCRWCAFRAACAPFFRSVESSWGLGDRSVLGSAEELDLTRRRPFVALRAELGNVDQEDVVVVATDAKLLDGISVGDVVSVAGCAPTRSESTIECGWDGLVCIWDKSPRVDAAAD